MQSRVRPLHSHKSRNTEEQGAFPRWTPNKAVNKETSKVAKTVNIQVIRRGLVQCQCIDTDDSPNSANPEAIHITKATRSDHVPRWCIGINGTDGNNGCHPENFETGSIPSTRYFPRGTNED